MKIKSKTILILLVVGLSAIMTIPTALACTSRTPGYWKNHADQWVIPVNCGGPITMDIGGQQLTKDQLLAVLNSPVKGHAAINLKQKLIALALSMGGDPDGQDGWGYTPNFGGTNMGLLWIAANELLELNPTIGPQSPARAEALSYASTIDYWLNFYDAD